MEKELLRKSSSNWLGYLLLRAEYTAYPVLQRQQGKNVDDEVVALPAEVFGRPTAPAGTWASAIRIIDPVEV